MPIRVLPLLLLTTLLASPGAARAQNERAQVMAAVEGFLKGMLARDTVAMAQYIDPATRMTLLRPGPSGVRVVVLTGADFLRAASNPNQPPLDEPIRNAVVHIDADLAHVWAEYQVRREGTVSHCGYDSFQLARLGGKWKILNVSDTFRQTGCGEPWR
ncbi:MAG: nuclear transport factor 2 family protein [Longimicrobiales bacterium]